MQRRVTCEASLEDCKVKFKQNAYAEVKLKGQSLTVFDGAPFTHKGAFSLPLEGKVDLP